MRFDATRERATLVRASELALDFLHSLDGASVATTTPLAELRRRFVRPLLEEGTDPVRVIEEAAGAWLKEVLGLPAGASFAVVTGCQMVHATGVAAARHALLARRGWDVNRDGLAGAPAIRVLTSDAVHGTTTRAAKLLGFGTANLVVLPSDASSRLTAPVLREAWVHVDGAMGLWCNATPSLRHLLAGVARADSWATDGHKWLNVPYDSGYAFVAHPEHHRAGMEHRASYLSHADDARDELDWTPEHSRRVRGVATWAALRELGRRGLAELIEGCCRHAHHIVTRIGALPGAQVMCIPVINQGLVRFLDPRAGAAETDHDRRTDEVMAAIVATGEAYFTGTTWRGQRCMRVSVSSWRTDTADVDRAVAAAAGVLAGRVG